MTKELTHVVADVEVLDVSGKTFPRDGAVGESKLDVFHRTVVHPMKEKVEGGRVGERKVDNGVGVGGGNEMRRSNGEGGLGCRGGSRPAEEASQKTRLRAEIIDMDLMITVRSTAIGKR